MPTTTTTNNLKKMERQSGSRSIDPGDGSNNHYYRTLDADDGETALVSNIEDRGRNLPTGADGFRPAVNGERAPLGVPNLGKAFGDEEDPYKAEGEGPGKRKSFKSMANRVRSLQKMARMNRQASNRSLNSNAEETGHRRAHTLLASIDEANNLDEYGEFETDAFGIRQRKQASRDFETIDNIWESLGETIDHDLPPAPEVETTQPNSTPTVAPESRPLLSDQRNEEQSRSSPRITRRNKIKSQWNTVAACLNPCVLFRRFMYWMSSSFLLAAFPCWIFAWVLFYEFKNPELDFLPGTATLSWWLNFFGRHLLLLEISRIIQYLVVDLLALSTRVIVTVLGPWVTIFCLQSRGWPFLVGGWGILAMLLLHGDNEFQQHWLHFTGIKIYASANSGSYILQSDIYLRILLGMVLAGFATSVKRTIVTLYFGKRNFEMYKPKLEEILNDIIVITDVAELAAEADNLGDDMDGKFTVSASQAMEANLKKRGVLSEVRWSSVRFKKDETRSRLDSEEVSTPHKVSRDMPPADQNDKLPYEKRIERSTSLEGVSRTSTGRMKIKNLLDRWEEPVNKLDKTMDSTVNDILKFRKALTYMDLEHPFSTAFGPASNRDELISSAESVYARLLRLAPGARLLPYSVLAVLCENDDGTIDREKKKSLQNLFRPDMDHEVTLLAFIQSCDTVYKKLRYFRASVGNSSVIDKVLEGIINAAFFFILSLMILSMLNLNPWPVLVSMTTLLVTFAFAVGPSIAKAIEGILLIVGRRPYDIGDRIVISDSPGGAAPGVAMSWMVEDITLFTTTLRFGMTNEVATISNGSIAAARISNCARSKNAVVIIEMKLHIHIHEGDNLELMRSALENYISDNSNVWDSMLFLRCDEIDTDNEYVIYKLAVRSRHTWQIAARVLMDRSQLHQFAIGVSKKLGVAFASPQPTRVLYYAGSLVQGAVEDYKKNLTRKQNVSSRGSMDMKATAKQAQEENDLVASPIKFAEEPVMDQTQDQTHNQSNSAVNNAFLEMIQQAQN